MKKSVIILPIILLIVFPFACTSSCTGLDNSRDEYIISRTLTQDNHVTIDLEVQPSQYNYEITSNPEHAKFYQFEADIDQDTYFYFYRADTGYVGIDVADITFTYKHAESPLEEYSMYYTLKFFISADTTSSE